MSYVPIQFVLLLPSAVVGTVNQEEDCYGLLINEKELVKFSYVVIGRRRLTVKFCKNKKIKGFDKITSIILANNLK